MSIEPLPETDEETNQVEAEILELEEPSEMDMLRAILSELQWHQETLSMVHDFFMQMQTMLPGAATGATGGNMAQQEGPSPGGIIRL